MNPLIRDMRIKKFINVTFYVFILAGFIFLLAPRSWWPSFYSPIFFCIASFVSAFFIIAPQFIFKSSEENKHKSIIFLQYITSFSLIIGGLGELYLYQLYRYNIQYDKLLHLVIPFLFVVALTFFGMHWLDLKFKKSLYIAAIGVFLGCISWELFEYLSDAFFKTSEFGIYGQDKFVDTVLDVLCDIVGVIAGIIRLNNKNFYDRIVQKYF